MERYQQGKIYAIICRKTERRYVGSTYEPTLAKRLAKHVADFKCWLKDDKTFCSSYDIIKDDDYYIVLLESYPCNSRDELRMCEQKHIDSCECLNKNKAFQSKKERKDYNKQHYDKYREKNYEKVLEYSKQYWDKNCDELNAKRRERVCCPTCQKEFNKSYFSQHKKRCLNS